MAETVRQRVVRWDSEYRGSTPGAYPTYARIYDQIAYFERERYMQFLPASNSLPRFGDRLAKWLDGVSEQDQKTLLRFVPKLFFVNREEQTALFRAAFRDPILRWLIDVAGIALNGPATDDEIDAAISATWFCGITDSMPTNSFLKVNEISGVKDSLPWKSVLPLLDNDPDAITKILAAGNVPTKYVILLEDFVGSGLQMRPILRFASALGELPILVVPLVCCTGGTGVGNSFAQRHDNISFEPVLELKDSAGLNRTALPGEDPLFCSVRTIVLNLQATEKVVGKPFGFYADGPLYISYSNCPNNAPPFLHRDNGTLWSSLFKRVSRT